MDQEQQPIQPVATAPVQQQPVPQPEYNTTPGANPGKKKLPVWVKVVIIIGSVGLLAGIAGIIAVNVALSDNDEEVQGFLSSIYASDYSAAYDYFSPELKAVQTQDTFELQVQSLQAAGVDSTCQTNWTTNSVASSTTTGDTKQIGGALDCATGSYSARFELVKQDDDYKLYSYSIQPN